jgi:hypothetical protein
MAILNDGLETSALEKFEASGLVLNFLRWLPDRAIQALSECIKQGLRTPYREGIMSR